MSERSAASTLVAGVDCSLALAIYLGLCETTSRWLSFPMFVFFARICDRTFSCRWIAWQEAGKGTTQRRGIMAGLRDRGFRQDHSHVLAYHFDRCPSPLSSAKWFISSVPRVFFFLGQSPFLDLPLQNLLVLSKSSSRSIGAFSKLYERLACTGTGKDDLQVLLIQTILLALEVRALHHSHRYLKDRVCLRAYPLNMQQRLLAQPVR